MWVGESLIFVVDMGCVGHTLESGRGLFLLDEG